MATKKESNFVTFNKFGDKVEGKISGFSTSQYGLIIALDNGNLISANKAQLMNVLKEHRDKLKAGAKIKIQFIDEKKVKGQKNKVKIFAVYLNGKEIRASQTFHQVDKLADKSFDVLFS